jgi:capsular polysaccharide biosynthesis protein
MEGNAFCANIGRHHIIKIKTHCVILIIVATILGLVFQGLVNLFIITIYNEKNYKSYMFLFI